MMVFIGLFLVPVIVLIISMINDIHTSDFKRRMYKFLLFIISIIYIVLCFVVNKEPFQFEIIRPGDYFIYTLVIFVFSPFLWINFAYFVKNYLKKFRIAKRSKIKNRDEFKYYRDNLNKVSPGVVSFSYYMENKTRESIAATILKLKLCGFIDENGIDLKMDISSLLDSEKLVLSSLTKKVNVDEKKYNKLVVNESISHGYLIKQKNVFVKILKITIPIVVSVGLLIFSIKFDKYAYSNYKTYVKDGTRYVRVYGDESGDVHFGTTDNVEIYYHGYVDDSKKLSFYDKSLIKADYYENSFVKKTAIIQGIDLVVMVSSIIIAFMSITYVIDSLIFINKNYIRTTKGNKLVTDAYRLKNFLKDFSIIDKRKENEVILWEYYLIYSLILDLNTDLDYELINKYLKK